MNNTKLFIYIVSENLNSNFRSMISLLDGLYVEKKIVHSLNDLFIVKDIADADLVILSTDIMDEDGIDCFVNSKYILHCAIAVAGEYDDENVEYKLRQAGITCYLMLPEEASLIVDFVSLIRRDKYKNCSGM